MPNDESRPLSDEETLFFSLLLLRLGIRCFRNMLRIDKECTSDVKNLENVLPENAILGEIVNATPHFCFRLEIRFGSPMFVIYHVDRIKVGREVTGRYSETLAIKECHYLEGLNYGN